MEFHTKHERFVFPLVLKSLLGGHHNLEGMKMLFALDGVSGGESADSYIPVVREFFDVFTPELPELPPEREFKFCIDLILEKSHVSIASYRIALAEFVELQTQLDDLLSRVLRHGGHLFLLSRNMMGPYGLAWIIASSTRSP